ncbi:MAG: glycosyltransferase [Caulobacteraceae bacterium]
MSLSSALRRLGRAATPAWARRMVGRAVFETTRLRAERRARREARIFRDPPPVERILPGPLVFSGFLDEVLGIGRAGRLAVGALEEAGFPVVGHGVRAAIMYADPLVQAPFPTAEPGGVWVLHCNAPEARTVLTNIRRGLWRNRYLIGYWAWELEELPEAWCELASEFHEIWVLSHFMADAVRPYARRVKVMWPRMPDLSHVRPDPARFGLPAAVNFGALADARSTLVRKNPAGAIAAFKKAFPEPDGRAALTVKLVEPQADAEGVAALERLAEGRPDIRFYVEDLTDAEMSVFLASLDGLISLHRSEGFGLAIAEVLALGKPAVATAWSANLDFMLGEAARTLVPFDLIPVADPSARYVGGRWADPDLDAAASLIRRLVEDAAFRDAVGGAGPSSVSVLREPWRPEALKAQPWARLVKR